MNSRRPVRRRREDPFAWLDLVVTDGPFLSRPALRAAFAQGLPRPDATVGSVADTFATEFGPWEKAWTASARAGDDDAARRRYLRARDAWVETMVRDVLGWGTYYTTDDPAGTLTAASLDGHVSLTPTGVLTVAGTRYALLLVVDPSEDLTTPGTDGWAASPIDRAAALLRASTATGTGRVPVALVTDGRWWSLVWTSPTGAVGSGTFDGALFREEPDLRDAFWALARLTSLAGGTTSESLLALLEKSIATAEEITEALGAQVRSAVELLVQAFSAAHLHTRRTGAPSPLPADGNEVYDAAVTVMMRVVFLLFAEANELLPTEELFRQAYAISDVGDRLDERRRNATGIEGEEALAATSDTWHRLLATSRALYEGATFEDLRMPAYGGSLFDPDRFAWLTAADPAGGLRVRVDDLVMFHVLRAVQHARIGGEDRQISFRELDVEQIGYVYEGLLGYTARYTADDEVIVGLDGKEAGSEPEIPLTVLNDLAEDADEDADTFAAGLLAWAKAHQPGAKPRTPRQIAKAYADSGVDAVWDEARRKLRPVVEDDDLVEDLAGYYLLMRRDLRDLPYVVPGGGLVVVETPSRATSGTHYTPRALAEEVVHHALEPLIYDPGPLQTADTTAWVPVAAAQILDLKVADIACGSGAFLVAAARYLGRALLAAWDREGFTWTDTDSASRHRREIEARREVIARCIYGADINPLAVEMCKLSLWLVSLDPDRPFSFVDDKILTGNSLLGLTTLRQLRGLHIDPSRQRLANPGFTVDIDGAIEKAKELRELLATPVSDGDTMRSTRAKRALLAQLDANNDLLRTVADAIIATSLVGGRTSRRELDASFERLSLALLAAYPQGVDGDARQLDAIIRRGLGAVSGTGAEHWVPLHWAIELPEVVGSRGGFDAIVGNPPWIAHAGRASVTLPEELKAYYISAFDAFKGYRTTHGMFLERACVLSRHDATICLIVPTSVADLDGYAPTRSAVTQSAVIREPLMSYGERRFSRVFMPCMRFAAIASGSHGRIGDDRTWQVRSEVEGETNDLGLAALLSSCPRFPPELFREVGLQTTPASRSHIGAQASNRVPLLEGKDLSEFSTPVPRNWIDESALSARDAQQLSAQVLIRQTARYPIACPSPRLHFRNSVIGIFPSEPWTADVLLGVLNSRLIRWFHYSSFRDAREGMPQLKIGHLRKYPAPRDRTALAAISHIARELVANPGDPTLRSELDREVEAAYGTTAGQRSLLADWLRTVDP